MHFDRDKYAAAFARNVKDACSAPVDLPACDSVLRVLKAMAQRLTLNGRFTIAEALRDVADQLEQPTRQ